MIQYIEKEIDVTIDIEDEEVILRDIPIFATVDTTDPTYWEPGSCEIEVDMLLSRDDVLEMVQQELIIQGLPVPNNLQASAGKFLQQVKKQAREYVEQL